MSKTFGNEYIILGGSGYFGSNFIYQKMREDERSVIINIDLNEPAGFYPANRLFWLKYDLADEKNVNRIYRDILKVEHDLKVQKRILINFAAQSFVDRSISSPEDTLMNNVNIVLNMLKLIERMNCLVSMNLTKNDSFQVIHISTDEVHILGKKDIRDVSAYALSKKICEEILLKVSTSGNNMKKRVFKIVRPVNLYGVVSRRNADAYGLWQRNNCIITKLMKAVKNRSEQMNLYLSESTRHFINIQRACGILNKVILDEIDETKVYLMNYDFHIVIKDLILSFIDRYSLTNVRLSNQNPRGRFEDDGYGIPEMKQNKQFEMDDFWNMMDLMVEEA